MIIRVIKDKNILKLVKIFYVTGIIPISSINEWPSDETNNLSASGDE